MTDFCNISNPSAITETDNAYRIKKTSESGHTRIRPIGRSGKKEITVEWSSMSSSDKAVLQAFFASNSSLAFNWTHPLTNTVYSVFFEDDSLSFRHVRGSVNRWNVTVKLSEV